MGVNYLVDRLPSTYTGNMPAIDKVWHLMRKEYPAAKVIEVHVPGSDSASIAASANPDDGTYYHTDYRYFAQYMKIME